MTKNKHNDIERLGRLLDNAPDITMERDAQDEAALRDLIRLHLAGAEDAYRQRLQTELLRGAPLTGKNGIRKRLAAVDLGFFGRAYLGHYFSRPSPEFHNDLDNIWHKGVLKGVAPIGNDAKTINTLPGCKYAVAAPRGHAKSTNLTFKDTLHAIIYEYKHYIMILSDSYDQSVGFLGSIKDELDENSAILEDFGDLSGKVWREDVIVTRSRIKVEALGAGQKIRGRKHGRWRPDLIVLDDIENDENVRTPEQRKKLENWYYKAVSKAGDTYTDIIYIGTLLHYDSLLAKVLKNPSYRALKYQAVLEFSSSPLWDMWASIFVDLGNDNREAEAMAYFERNRAEMLKGTRVLWEDKLSYYDLMIMRLSEGEGSFNSELQNEPINPDDCLFNEEWFDYYNPYEINFSDPQFLFFGFVDPSLGKSKKSDFSAIITIAKHTGTGYMYVADADIERRHPDKIIADVMAKADWIKRSFNKRYTRFGAETNQFQWFLKEQIAKESARLGIYLPIHEVNQTSDKTMRIQTLQPDIKNKYIKFNAQHKRLLEQLKYFPLGDHDDGPDALEGCRALAAQKRGAGFVTVRM